MTSSTSYPEGTWVPSGVIINAKRVRQKPPVDPRAWVEEYHSLLTSMEVTEPRIDYVMSRAKEFRFGETVFPHPLTPHRSPPPPPPRHPKWWGRIAVALITIVGDRFLYPAMNSHSLMHSPSTLDDFGIDPNGLKTKEVQALLEDRDAVEYYLRFM